MVQRVVHRPWLPAALILLLVQAVGAQERKLVVVELATFGPTFDGLGISVSRAVARAVDDRDDWRASAVRPGQALALPASADALAREVADATGAEAVLLGSILAPNPEVLVVSLSLFDVTRGELWLPDPLRLPVDRANSRGAVEALVSRYVLERLRELAYPTAVVLDVADGAEGRDLVVRLDGPLPVEPAYAVVGGQSGAPLMTGGFRLTRPPGPVSGAQLVAGDVGAARLRVDPAWPVAIGEQVQLAPAAAAMLPVPVDSVVLTSYPSGAIVQLDGRVTGTTPLRVPVPSAGRLEVTLAYPGRQPSSLSLRPEAREQGLIEVTLGEAAAGAATRAAPTNPERTNRTLRPATPVAPPSAPAAGSRPGPGSPAPSAIARRLTVRSEPASAEVLVDGVPRGLTPLTLDDVAGQATVVVRRPGYRDWQAQILATGPASLMAELEPEAGQLTVTSTPPGARVYVDGRSVGLTPLTLDDVPTGQRRVRVVPQGGAPVVRDVQVQAGVPARLQVAAGETSSVRGEGAVVAPPITMPAGSRMDTARSPLDKLGMLFERKLNVAGRGGRLPARMHLVVCGLQSDGSLVSFTLWPPAGYTVGPWPGGFAIDYPGLKLDQPINYAVQGVPEVLGMALVPTSTGLQVRVELAPGVEARVHDSSTLERLRLIVRHRAQSLAGTFRSVFGVG